MLAENEEMPGLYSEEEQYHKANDVYHKEIIGSKKTIRAETSE